MAQPYDVVVIGGGPGGFSAATRAAARGARVCLVEAKELGGVCLNTGCIPSRAIGMTASVASLVARSDRFGVKTSPPEIVWPDAVARKDRIVQRLRNGLAQLARQRRIELIAGRAVLHGPGQVVVTAPGMVATTRLETRAVIVATGSRPKPWAAAPFDGRRILSSDDLLRAEALPARLAVIGGGVIGCELASYLAPLGVEVTVYELAPQLLPGQDPELAHALETSLTKAGVRVITNARVTAVTPEGDAVTIACHRCQGGQAPLAPVDQVLVTIGRQPNTAGLGWESVGVTLAPSGAVPVDRHLRTATPTIFAVGDILGRQQTAYTASEEGAVAAENALGALQTVDDAVIPDCIFTLPEMATVGLTEAQARAGARSVAVSRVPWGVSGRAHTLDETDGFVKVVYDASDQRLLGVQMIGPRATDLIAEAALALKRQMTLTDLVQVLHAHPTLSETLWEAAAQPLGRALYVR
ncbi:MAG: dihydrolipoyl dehydrogenase [Candidatus Omnitrophica bacterium]|nr:dihydrolipoyl dehydrogenase [Candidatus Omnitrophota bacterium]